MSGKKYILNKIEEFDDADRETLFRSPTIINGGGLMLCTHGGCDILINAKSYSVKRWDLIVVSPYSIIQVIDIYPDFDCVILGASLDFFSQVELPNKGALFLNLTSHPSISLTQTEAEEIIELRDMLKREERNREQQFYGEVRDAILKIIVFKVCNLYSDHEPNREIVQSRSSEILNSFIVDLLKYNTQERKLEFYAQRQFLSPSYLSRCVKSVTNQSASTILIESVINNIKYRLADSNSSISEISEEFHFSSSSSFSQYFKKYTSLSPNEYRRMRRKGR